MFNNKNDQMTQTFIMISLSIIFMIAIPLFIIGLPFMMAWTYTRAIMDAIRINRKEESKFDDSKWSMFINDLSKWSKGKE